jgi:hypothetical protein
MGYGSLPNHILAVYDIDLSLIKRFKDRAAYVKHYRFWVKVIGCFWLTNLVIDQYFDASCFFHFRCIQS